MDIQAVLPILVSWAVHLSNYPMPEELPVVQFEPHAFFVQHVCGGKECNAVGWYNDEDIIYIDDRFVDAESGFIEGLLVHEVIHYLQHHSGRYDSTSCEDSLAREREAYSVQNSYIVEAQASFAVIWPAPTVCAYDKAVPAAHFPE